MTDAIQLIASFSDSHHFAIMLGLFVPLILALGFFRAHWYIMRRNVVGAIWLLAPIAAVLFGSGLIVVLAGVAHTTLCVWAWYDGAIDRVPKLAFMTWFVGLCNGGIAIGFAWIMLRAFLVASKRS